MIENIKQFFQSMYDATIGAFIGWVSEFFIWVSNSWDLVLYIIIFIFAVLSLWLTFKLLAPIKTLLQIVLSTALILAMVAFVAWFGSILIDIYNHIMQLSGFMNNGGNLGCFGHMLNCLGVRGILGLYFTQLFAVLITVLMLRAYLLFMWGKKLLSSTLSDIRLK